MELMGTIGFSNLKAASYCFNPLSGDLLYTCGSAVVVYSIKDNVQKGFLQNPKGHPYSSVCISLDGKDLLTAEAFNQRNDIHQWTYNPKDDTYTKKHTLKTSFQQIENI